MLGSFQLTAVVGVDPCLLSFVLLESWYSRYSVRAQGVCVVFFVLLYETDVVVSLLCRTMGNKHYECYNMGHQETVVFTHVCICFDIF